MRKNVVVSGDQHPLNGGLLRAYSVFKRGFETHYFRQDADGQSEWKQNRKSIRKLINQHGNYQLITVSGRNVPFTLLGLRIPFTPNARTEDVKLEGVSASKMAEEIGRLSAGMPSRLDIISTNDQELKANLNNLNTGKLVWRMFYGSSQNIGYLSWLWKIASTLSKSKRIGSHLRIVLCAIVLVIWRSIPGLSVTKLMWWLGQLCLGRVVPKELKQSSLELFKDNTNELKKFWKVTLHGMTNKGIPFFVLSGSKWRYNRKQAPSVEAILSSEYVIPKFDLLYLWLRTRGRLLSGGLPYANELERTASVLRLTLLPEMHVNLHPGTVLSRLGVMPTTNGLTSIWAQTVNPDSPFRKKLLTQVVSASLDTWQKGENIDTLTLWVLGGWRAVKLTVRSAT